MNDTLARLRLARSEGVGPTNHRRLLERLHQLDDRCRAGLSPGIDEVG